MFLWEKTNQQGISLAQAARDLGLGENLLSLRRRSWLSRASRRCQQALPGHGHAQEDELVQLRHEAEVLRRERELLKKDVGIFSQQLLSGTSSSRSIQAGSV